MPDPKLPTKWTIEQRRVFKSVRAEVIRLNNLLLHPVTVERKFAKREFATIAWNVAWIAAETVVGRRIDLEVAS